MEYKFAVYNRWINRMIKLLAISHNGRTKRDLTVRPLVMIAIVIKQLTE